MIYELLECNYRVTCLIKLEAKSVFALQGPRHTCILRPRKYIIARRARQVTKLMQIRVGQNLHPAAGNLLRPRDGKRFPFWRIFEPSLHQNFWANRVCMHIRGRVRRAARAAWLAGIVFYFREIYVTSTNRCFSLARWNKVLSRYISPQLKLHCVVCCCCCCRRAAVIIYTRGVWRWRKCSALLLTIILRALRLDIFHMHHHTPPPP